MQGVWQIIRSKLSNIKLNAVNLKSVKMIWPKKFNSLIFASRKTVENQYDEGVLDFQGPDEQSDIGIC